MCVCVCVCRDIVQYIGYGYGDQSNREMQKKSLFLVTEYLEGGTLKHLLLREGQAENKQQPLYRAQDAMRWAMSIAQGLNYLHTAQPKVGFGTLKKYIA